MIQPFRFFGGVGQHPFALVAEWNIHGLWYGRSSLTFSVNPGADRSSHRFAKTNFAQANAVYQLAALAQESQKEVLCLDIGRSQVGSFVASVEDQTAGFLCIAVK